MYQCNFYCLINPIDTKTFYVGKTTYSLKYRLNCHILESKKNKSLKDKIIQNILSLDKLPQIVLLEFRLYKYIHLSKSGARERYWIRYFIKLEGSLTNIVGNPKVWTKKYRQIQCGLKNKKLQQQLK